MERLHPGIKGFADHATAHLRNRSADFFALEAPLKALLSTGVVADLVNEELRRIAHDRDYASERWDSPGLLLCGGDTWQLRLGIYDRTPENIYSLPFDLIVAVIGPEQLDLERFNLPLGRGEHLRFVERKRLPPGSTVRFDALCDAVAIRVARPLAVLKLSSNTRTPLQRAFCRKTHRALQAISADARHSDLASMAQAMGAMRREMSAKSLCRLAAHDAHFVRWAALQALAQVQPERAVHELRAAIHDAHPQIRNGAVRALAMLSQASTGEAAK